MGVYLGTTQVDVRGGLATSLGGKGLSTNDYTDEDKAKVDNLPSNTTTELNSKLSTSHIQTFSNITISSASFVADTTYGDYPYKADFTITGFSGTYSEYIPELFFIPPWTDNGVIASFCETTANGVRVYATEVPSEDVIVKTVRLTKGV